MKNLNSVANRIVILAIVTSILVAWFAVIGNNSHRLYQFNNTSETVEIEHSESEDGLMNLIVHLQNKEEVLYSDCGITYPKSIQVSKTKAVADVSLKYLFENELSQYGKYESIAINNSIAQITISNENDLKGSKISGLSSCESRHLFKVLEKTLTQYETIESIELFSPSGKIEF